jgi:hypothetical protein
MASNPHAPARTTINLSPAGFGGLLYNRVSVPPSKVDALWRNYLLGAGGDVGELKSSRATVSGVGEYTVLPATGTGALQAGAPPQRLNYVQQTQTFDNAWWSKGEVTVTTNAVAAPDGTMTADTVNDKTTNAQHVLVASLGTIGDNTFTASVYIKAGTGSWFRIHFSLDKQYEANFNLTNGVIGYISANGATAKMEHVGSDWYRCSLTTTPVVGAGSGTLYLRTLNGDVQTSFPPYVAQNWSWHLWGAQVEAGAVATAYIPQADFAIAPVATSPLTGAGVLGRIHGAWDSTFVDDSNAVYSNSDRTVTLGSTSYPFSTDGYTPGGSDLVYAEITVGVAGVGTSPTVQVGDRTWSNQAVFERNGQLYNYAVYVGLAVGGAFTTGDVIGIAYKSSTNEVWFRENNGGWNVGGTDSPVTGLGGIPVGGAGPVFINSEGLSNHVLTINTGTVAFAYTVPSGFQPWYGPPIVVGVTGTGALLAAAATLSGSGTVASEGLITLSPDGDVATDGWTDKDGGTTNIWQGIANASDVDYVQSPALAATSDLVVRLFEGSTLVQQWTHNDVGEAFNDAVQTVTGSVGNFSNLFVELDDLQGNVYRFALGNPASGRIGSPEIAYRYKKLVS